MPFPQENENSKSALCLCSVNTAKRPFALHRKKTANRPCAFTVNQLCALCLLYDSGWTNFNRWVARHVWLRQSAKRSRAMTTNLEVTVTPMKSCASTWRITCGTSTVNCLQIINCVQATLPRIVVLKVIITWTMNYVVPLPPRAFLVERKPHPP